MLTTKTFKKLLYFVFYVLRFRSAEYGVKDSLTSVLGNTNEPKSEMEANKDKGDNQKSNLELLTSQETNNLEDELEIIVVKEDSEECIIVDEKILTDDVVKGKVVVDGNKSDEERGTLKINVGFDVSAVKDSNKNYDEWLLVGDEGFTGGIEVKASVVQEDKKSINDWLVVQNARFKGSEVNANVVEDGTKSHEKLIVIEDKKNIDSSGDATVVKNAKIHNKSETLREINVIDREVEDRVVKEEKEGNDYNQEHTNKDDNVIYYPINKEKDTSPIQQEENCKPVLEDNSKSKVENKKLEANENGSYICRFVPKKPLESKYRCSLYTPDLVDFNILTQVFKFNNFAKMINEKLFNNNKTEIKLPEEHNYEKYTHGQLFQKNNSFFISDRNKSWDSFKSKLEVLKCEKLVAPEHAEKIIFINVSSTKHRGLIILHAKSNKEMEKSFFSMENILRNDVFLCYDIQNNNNHRIITENILKKIWMGAKQIIEGEQPRVTKINLNDDFSCEIISMYVDWLLFNDPMYTRSFLRVLISHVKCFESAFSCSLI